jgi:hypothetical protein
MRLSDIEEIAAMLLYEARKARDRGMQLEEFADGARQQAVDEWPQRTDFYCRFATSQSGSRSSSEMMGGHKPRHQSQL